MSAHYHTTDVCVTANDAVSGKQSGSAPKAGRHGPTLKVWRGMRARCTNPKSASWANYGGRGIAVCDRWSTYENFLADMGERPDGLSIDRIDNDGNYEPGNCRWATAKEQGRNKRANVLYEYKGEELCLAEIAERACMPAGLVSSRLDAGWSMERATTTASGDGAPFYTRVQVAIRDMQARRRQLEASGLTVDQIANRAPRPSSAAVSAPTHSRGGQG